MYSVADVKSVKSFLGFVLIKCCLLSYIVMVLLLKFADLMLLFFRRGAAENPKLLDYHVIIR